MIYNILLILFSLFSTLEVLKVRINKMILHLLLIILFLLDLFRYGVGADYFGYRDIYKNTYPLSNFEFLKMHHGEPGYLFFSSLFKSFNISFEYFNMAFSLIIIYIFYKIIVKKTNHPFTSLLVFYSLFFITYPFNAIRQAFTISIFLYYIVDLIILQKMTKFYLVVILCSLFHYSSLILLILPMLLKLKLDLYNAVIIFLLVVLFPLFGIWDKIIASIFSLNISNYLNDGFSIYALLTRLLFAIPIVIWGIYSLKKEDLTNLIYFKIYLLGIFIYLSFSSSAILASRLTIYMKSLEIFLIPVVIFSFSRLKGRLLIYLPIFFLLILMFYKCIYSQISNSTNLTNTSFLKYPYYTILNKTEIDNKTAKKEIVTIKIKDN